jgi:hypothetical protein
MDQEIDKKIVVCIPGYNEQDINGHDNITARYYAQQVVVYDDVWSSAALYTENIKAAGCGFYGHS